LLALLAGPILSWADGIEDSSSVAPAADPVSVAPPAEPASTREEPAPGCDLRKTRWLVIPAVFSLPETGPGAALKARGRDFLGMPGYLDATLLLTWKRQVDFDLEWLRDSLAGVWRLRNGVQVGRFPSLWYGRGNPPPDGAEATYDPLYVVADTRVARYLSAGWALEGSLLLDVEDVTTDDAGAFREPTVAREGGTFVVGGAAIEFEGRDLPEDPREGLYFRSRAQSSIPGSETLWHSWQNDVSGAFTLWRTTFVGRVRTVDGWGDIPFWETPYLGYREALRGLPDRRLRGDAVQCAGLEVRLRMPKLWIAPWQLATFLEEGRAGTHRGVWSAEPLPAGGGGVRVLLDGGRSVLRADYGLSPKGTGIYLDFGQAF